VNGCVFCEVLDSSRVIHSDELCVAIKDRYPVSEGHCLVIPRRCIPDYFSLNEKELLSADRLLRDCRSEILNADTTVEGFNIGVNCGEKAGQTILHCHFYLIPRRANDVSDPTGGIRGVIPSMANYKKIPE